MTPYQFHDGCSPTGQQLDSLVSHVRQLLGCLVIQTKVTASDDLENMKREENKISNFITEGGWP